MGKWGGGLLHALLRTLITGKLFLIRKKVFFELENYFIIWEILFIPGINSQIGEIGGDSRLQFMLCCGADISNTSALNGTKDSHKHRLSSQYGSTPLLNNPLIEKHANFSVYAQMRKDLVLCSHINTLRHRIAMTSESLSSEAEIATERVQHNTTLVFPDIKTGQVTLQPVSSMFLLSTITKHNEIKETTTTCSLQYFQLFFLLSPCHIQYNIIISLYD